MPSKSLLLNRFLIGASVLLCISLTLNVWLLTPFSDSNSDMNYKPFTNHEHDCFPPHQQSSPFISSAVSLRTDNNNSSIVSNDPCHLTTPLKRGLYVYNIPTEWREAPRSQWYARHTGLDNYNRSRSLNFGFGPKMSIDSSSSGTPDMHLTHMHVLEIILNERLKRDDYYITDDPSEAVLFHIPYAFALHYRYWERLEAKRIERHHRQLQDWLNANPVYQTYFLNADTRRPHILTFGRIAYETNRLDSMRSQFFQVTGDVSKYWILSIDRNCHGDPPACWKRVSMPHPSNFHPRNVHSLKLLISQVKHDMVNKQKKTLVSFCGYVRTEHRNISRATCNAFNRKSKWRAWSTYSDVCVFEDGERIKAEVGKNRVKVQHAFSKRCDELYRDSVFCLQDGADSTTRKGLWDGIIAGCVPVFLTGVMSDEFTCFGDNLHPWHVVLQREFYVTQLLALPPEYVQLLQMNLLRLIPRILYTDGNAGFSDAFDVILHCLMRKTSLENKALNPQCTQQYLVDQHAAVYDFDRQLGYDKLYEYLEI